MAEDEALVYDFVTELTTTQKVSDETYARAKKVFNDQQIVDLTAVAGNYVMVAMLLAMAEETVPPGKEAPFKVGEKWPIHVPWPASASRPRLCTTPRTSCPWDWAVKSGVCRCGRDG